KLGDELGVAMGTAPKQLYPSDASWFLLVGDATAIPVLGAILEDLPPSAQGICVIQVASKEDIQELSTKAAMEFHWIVGDAMEDESRLVQRVKIGRASCREVVVISGGHMAVKKNRDG